MEAFKEPEVSVYVRQEKKIRKGYLGQLVKIANRILESTDPVIQKYTENNVEWEDYVMSELYSINSRNSKQLGGLNPKIERYGSFEIQVSI